MRKLPFDKVSLEAIASKYPTPFHIYDEQGIRQAAHGLQEAFSWNTRFKEFFAVKAQPKPNPSAAIHMRKNFRIRVRSS